MPRSPSEAFDVPPEVRALAEKSVEQVRQAFEGVMSAAHRTVSSIEGQAELASKNARDAGRTAVTFAKHNIGSSFDLLQRLARARDLDEVLRLQGDYIKTQMQALADQAKTIGEQTTEAAEQTTEAAKEALRRKH